MKEKLRTHQSHALRSISVVEGKGEDDTSGNDDVAGVTGVMSHATADRLRDSDSGFYSLFTPEAFPMNGYSRKVAEV